jgi:VanZ family protein
LEEKKQRSSRVNNLRETKYVVDLFKSRDKIIPMPSYKIFRWLPAILLMAAIFIFSSFPSDSLPNFDIWDRIVKKGGHMVGYGSLAISFWFAMRNTKRRGLFAWLLAILYAVSDEYHQYFVPGRQASVWDVLIYDNLGAAIGMLIATIISKVNK